MRCPLTYKVISECSTTKARVGLISLVHSNVDTPVGVSENTLHSVQIFFDKQRFNHNNFWYCRYSCPLVLKAL